MKKAVFALVYIAAVASASAGSLVVYASSYSGGTDHKSASGFVPAGASMYVHVSTNSSGSYAYADINGPGGLHVSASGAGSGQMLGGNASSSTTYNVVAHASGIAYASSQIFW